MIQKKRHPYYETTHYSKVSAVGGIKLVTSPDDLVNAARNYLIDPQLDSQQRRLLVNQQAYKLDGKSAQRIADQTISIINNPLESN